MTIRRILVGVDGSEHADRAVRWAADLADTTGADVVVAHALGLLFRSGDEMVASDAHREEIQRLLEDEWSAPLRERGVSHRAELRDGNPVTVMLELADECDADLLVMGSRGAGGFPALLLGSMSTQVAQHSTRPVVIVP